VSVRGTELTQQQIESAELFVRDRQCEGRKPQKDERISIRFDDLVRIVAWYGALRYKAGRDKDGGTLEAPGYFVVRKSDQQQTVGG
jgi:hypothetical protein